MLKVIIVEDEDIIRLGLEKTLDWAAMGASVVGTAADGAEGLALIEREHPDVVLTDIRMPRLGGLEMARKAREAQPALSVVFLTSYAEFDYAREAVRLGAADYLLKPVDEAALRAVLRKLAAQKGEADPPALVDWRPLLDNAALNIHVRRVLERLEDGYRERLSVEALADELAVSASYLSRKLKETTGHTCSSLLARRRLEAAISLLASGALAYEAADATGFSDYKTFCQTFKKYLHTSPKRFMLDREPRAATSPSA